MTASRSATQSPTAGRSAPEAASWRRRPARCARSSPCSVSTSYSPRCCAETRAAMQLSCGSSAAAKPSSQPRSCKFKRSSFQEWIETGRVPEASGSSLRKAVLRLAGSLRLCDRRVQSTSCRTSFAETANAKSLAAALNGRACPSGHLRLPKRKTRGPRGLIRQRLHGCSVRTRAFPSRVHPERAARRSLPPVALAGHKTRLAATRRQDERPPRCRTGTATRRAAYDRPGKARGLTPLRRGFRRG